VLRVKSNDAAKYVELYVAHLWTRVQFPPPPPITCFNRSKLGRKTQ
jgi:hypothetical protein